MKKTRAFTLMEMLIVIAIICVLAGLIMGAIWRAKEKGRRAACMSNLKQISTGIELYGVSNLTTMLPWITMLHQEKQNYLPDMGNKSVFVCVNDKTKGKDGGRPGPEKPLYYGGTSVIDQFVNADKDGPAVGQGFEPLDPGDDDPRNTDDSGINCSYMFEFNGYLCDWMYSDPQDPGTFTQGSVADYDKNGDGIVSWYEAKIIQVNGSSSYSGYGGVVPVVRCFWHCEGPLLDKWDYVLNIQYNYAVDYSGPKWEDKHK